MIRTMTAIQKIKGKHDEMRRSTLTSAFLPTTMVSHAGTCSEVVTPTIIESFFSTNSSTSSTIINLSSVDGKNSASGTKLRSHITIPRKVMGYRGVPGGTATTSMNTLKIMAVTAITTKVDICRMTTQKITATDNQRSMTTSRTSSITAVAAEGTTQT